MHLTRQNLRGHVKPPFQKKVSGFMSGLSLGACVPYLKFVSLVFLELLAFNGQKCKWSRDSGHAPFSKNFSGVMSGLSLGASVPNLKFIPLIILELLAFNAQKLRGHVTLATPPFRKIFQGSYVGTFPGSIRAKFEVRTFNHFKAISI